ncbi:MAG: NAD(P)-dependent dehydrogenase (short-subunit alcohol dehydrogenase family) [Limisphaerales bacterium]|jgi:NAD(P)-dependent dehydrogenase (short-subunit alcohol dehydrogenase family)
MTETATKTITTQAASWIDLTGKVAHITGSARGIGRGIAQALKLAGATIMISDQNGTEVAATATELNCEHMVLDVTDAEAAANAMGETKARLGSLDILVNNAGVYIGFGGPVREITDDMWRTSWAVNVDGVFYCCRAAADIMIEQATGGRIINISSTQAVSPGVGVSYDGTKAAVAQITKSLALELAQYQINVNSLAPGPTWVREGPAPAVSGQPPNRTGDPLADTVADRIERLPLGKWADPMEQGKVAVFLASSLADNVTGVYLPCDGGWLTL